MKTGAAYMAGAALAASFALHLVGFTMMPAPDIQIEGGTPMQLAMLGNSFEDVSAGTVNPVATGDMTKMVDEAEPLQQPAPPEVSAPVTAPDQVQTPHPTTTALAVVENLRNPVVPMIAAPVSPVSTLTLQPPVAATSTPLETVPALAPTKPLETLTAEAPVEVQQATPDTRRPVARPAKPAVTRPKLTTPQRARTATAPPKPQGGQAARKGQADGSTTGQATSSSHQGTRSTAAGNAAASNYPGSVMRKISRIRKERAGARGKATVGFKVSASGAATSVRIISSSGSAKVDRIAIRHIQRASPFARPPKGARRSFSVVFVSKG